MMAILAGAAQAATVLPANAPTTEVKRGVALQPVLAKRLQRSSGPQKTGIALILPRGR